MTPKTYIKLSTQEKKGYIFDGTIECAKNIVQEIYKINSQWATGFNLKINLLDDSIHFDWRNYRIKNGDLVALSNANNLIHELIEIITPEELNLWGFQETKS